MSSARGPCAVCARESHWHVAGVDLCAGHYGDWAADLKTHCPITAREKLSHEEFRRRSEAQVQDWLQRRRAA